jgi:hypothetical protein
MFLYQLEFIPFIQGLHVRKFLLSCVCSVLNRRCRGAQILHLFRKCWKWRLRKTFSLFLNIKIFIEVIIEQM